MKKNIKEIAIIGNWRKIYDSVKSFLSELKIDKTKITHILLAIEEIFVNISKYAYPKSTGNVQIDCEYNSGSKSFTVHFIDEGVPFNPKKALKPNIYESVEKRKIGGLGIFMVNKLVDNMEYTFSGNKNHLILTWILD